MRAAVQSVWNRGVSFDKISIEYPYGNEVDEIDEEDLDEFLRELEDDQVSTAESEDHRIG
jgi:hypothetical protein